VFTAASRTHRLDTSIEIASTPERLWSILTDFAGYPRWNPFVRSIAGELEVGKTLDVSVEPPGGRAMKFHPVVLAVEPGRELRWKGKLLIPGLFDGEHWIRLRTARTDASSSSTARCSTACSSRATARRSTAGRAPGSSR
jgi:hypothetical protein